MHKKLLPVLFLLFSFLFAAAQQMPLNDGIKDSTFITAEKNDDDENTSGFAKEVMGDTLINFNEFEISKDSIIKWKNNKEYKWITNLDSFLRDKKKQAEKQPKITLKENRSPSFLDSIFGSGILQTILWMAAVALVLFIIYKLFLSNAVFGKRYKKVTMESQLDEEDITLANDYDSLLRRAYNAGNLRMAMRYMFLKTLQKLNHKEMIKYAVDKTNRLYVKEIPPAKRNLFASLALYYEYIWYGNAAVNKETFDSIEIKFNEFLNRL